VYFETNLYLYRIIDKQTIRAMKATIKKIENAIQQIIEGAASQYINCVNINGESVKIRVSNHKSNPSRMSDKDISLIVEVKEIEREREDDDVTSFTINKKSFNDIPNQFFLDENGSFVEHFQSIKELLNWFEIEF
jgi:hypothetical protein